MARTSEQSERAAAIEIAAEFLAGREGVGMLSLLKAAEDIRSYIEHGDEHVQAVRSRASSPRR